MKREIERLIGHAKALANVSPSPIDLEPRERRQGERRKPEQRHHDRREVAHDLARLARRVEQNARNLEVQFVRIAQLQAEFDAVWRALEAAGIRLPERPAAPAPHATHPRGF